MQKNLLLKTAIIIGVLLVFLYGIFGIPSGLSGDALKQAVPNRIHLGLDLKGGTHLILQVMVNDGVNGQPHTAAENLKSELQKAHIAFADISKPDADHPERILIQGVSPDAGPQLRSIVNDRFQQEYDFVGGANNTWSLIMKPAALNDLKTRTVDQSIEAIRNRVDSLGVSEPVIQRNGMGNDQILVQLPGVDDPGRVKEIIQSTARLELRQGFGSQSGYDSEDAARQSSGGVLPPNTVLPHGVGGGGDSQERVFIVGRVPVVTGANINDA